MIKKWSIVIAILCALVVGCILEYRFVNNTFEEMTMHFENVLSMLDQNQEHIDNAELLDYLEKLHNDFHQKEKVLKALIWHTGLKDVEIGISRIITYAQNNEYVEAMAETNGLVDYCKHYGQDFKISWDNIF